MGDNLHPTILTFFESRMGSHSVVQSITRIHVDGEVVYEIKRARYGDTIRVWLSDAYHFTEIDLENRPSCLKGGDYIMIARPEGGHVIDSETVKETKIGIGKLAEFMGALNKRQMWTYVPPSEEEKAARKASIRSKPQ